MTIAEKHAPTSWKDSSVKTFIDDENVTFIKGPFEVDGKSYDYKFKDKHGEDYCNEEQLSSWGVKLKKVLG